MALAARQQTNAAMSSIDEKLRDELEALKKDGLTLLVPYGEYQEALKQNESAVLPQLATWQYEVWYTKGLDLPVFCAIDAADNLWVTSAFNSRVLEYKPGATKPSTVITNGVTDPHGIAFDQSGNMYVSNYLGNYESSVAVFAPGHKSPSRTITDGLTTAAGIAVDAKGTLYVANEDGCNVEEYLPGEDQPYQEITDDIDGPTGLTMGKNGWLYVTNTGNQTCQDNGPWPVILEFSPGSLKPSHREVSEGLHAPFGSAYDPPLLP